MPDPRHGFEPRLGGVGVEAEHHGVGAGAERGRDLGVGRMQLAVDGDPLHAEAGSNGEMLDAAGERVIGAGGLSADHGAIDDGAGEEEDAEDEPFAAHAILPEPGEPDGSAGCG